MRRSLLIFATTVGIGAAVALPGVASAQTPTQDLVTGSGLSTFCDGTNRFEVDAESGPSGENPSGQINCGSLFTGPVTCLRVTGNVALLNLQSRTVGSVGFRITDLGATQDRVEASPGPTCPVPLSSFSDVPVVGDIVIVDASPLPSTKEQCKNGGWRTYGVFKNQGDCVSFVATKGKNPPAGGP